MADGTLLIDEAYSLCSGSTTDYGPIAVNTIMNRINECTKDKCPVLIFAGYPEDMDMFLKINPAPPYDVFPSI